MRYSLFGIGWSVLAACFAIAMSLRYEKIFVALLPKPVVYGVMASLWVAFFLPVIVVFLKPLRERRREAV